MTEARTYLGLDHALSGRAAAARDQFRWVIEHGSARCSEYYLARAELEMLAIYVVVIAVLVARPGGLFGKPLE